MNAKTSLKELYEALLSRYGPQHWWPVSFTPKNNLAQRRLEIMVGAILTQNTAWSNVELALANFARAGLLDWGKLKSVRLARLARLIRPAGYYNQKAGYIKNFVGAVAPEKSLDERPLPSLRKFLLGIKGIGPETADSMLLYALERPIFVIDSYTQRLFSRLGLLPERATYQETQDFVHNGMREQGKRRTRVFNEFHALIVRHAVVHCRAKPKCGKCVLVEWCANNVKCKNQNAKCHASRDRA